MAIAFLSVLTLLVYSRILGNYFLNDDFGRILMLAHLQDLPVYDALWQLVVNGYHVYYRPLTNIAFYLLRKAFELNATAYYFSSLLLHIIAAFSLYHAYRKLTAVHYGDECDRRGLWALGAVSFFLLNPRHVESVSYIHDNENVICGLFFFLGILSFVNLCSAPKWWGWCVFAAAYMGSLLGKEMGVTLPIVCLAYYVLLGRPTGLGSERPVWKDPVLLKASLVSLGVFSFYMIARYIAIGEFVGGYGATAELDFNLGRIVRTLMQAFVAMLLPNDLTLLVWLAEYFHRHLVVFAVAVLAVGGVGIWMLGKINSRMAIFGAIWVCVTMLPVLNNGIGVEVLTGGRYLYIPLAGMAICLAEMVRSLPVIRLRWVVVLGALFFYGASTYGNNAVLSRASDINEKFLFGIEEAYDGGGRKTAVVVPGMYRGMYILPSGFTSALEVVYGEKSAQYLQSMALVLVMRLDNLDVADITVTNEGRRSRLDISGGGILWQQELYSARDVAEFDLQMTDRRLLNTHGDFVARRVAFLHEGDILLPVFQGEEGVRRVRF
jgi:protein O-mannosyl-transferase